MKKIEMVKTVVELVLIVGVGAIAGNIIAHTTPKTVKTLTGVCIVVGTFVLGGMATEAAIKYANAEIDAIVAICKSDAAPEKV